MTQARRFPRNRFLCLLLQGAHKVKQNLVRSLHLLSQPTMKLLLCLASLILATVRADKVYYTVMYGNNVPTTVQNQLSYDQQSLLSVMDSSTPTTMSVYSTGDSFTSTSTTPTTTDNSVRKLQINTCPSKCSNSGSTYCKSLGCAYCTRCRRHLRSLMATSTATSIASSIKSSMDSDLSSYCSGISGCQLWTKVYEVLPNGTFAVLA
jgi:hypothetical protein